MPTHVILRTIKIKQSLKFFGVFFCLLASLCFVCLFVLGLWELGFDSGIEFEVEFRYIGLFDRWGDNRACGDLRRRKRLDQVFKLVLTALTKVGQMLLMNVPEDEYIIHIRKA